MTAIFIVGLVLSGLTAMPLQTQLDLVSAHLSHDSSLGSWLWRVRDAVAQINRDAPFIFYGDDWLAFGHIAIAGAFVPALRDPVKHRWLYDYGLILCAGVIVWAMCVGPFRGIPWGWRLIDCSFGVFGAVPLMIAKRSLSRVLTGEG